MNKKRKHDLQLYGILSGVVVLTLLLFTIMMPKFPTYTKTDMPQVDEISGDEIVKNPTFSGDDVPIVVIDPGHGGYDEGSQTESGVVEKNLNLTICEKVKTLLEAEGVKVIMTRTSDEVTWPNDNVQDLQARLDFATNAGADIMVSLHCNISDEDPLNVSGSEVYANSKQKNSTALAESIVASLDALDADLPSRGVKTGAFHLLTYNTLPTVIVEMGFLSNPNDVAYLTTEESQNTLCEAITEGIVNNLKD